MPWGTPKAKLEVLEGHVSNVLLETVAVINSLCHLGLDHLSEMDHWLSAAPVPKLGRQVPAESP